MKDNTLMSNISRLSYNYMEYEGLVTQAIANKYFSPPRFDAFLVEVENIETKLIDQLFKKSLILEPEISKKISGLIPEQHSGFILNGYNYYSLSTDFTCTEFDQLDDVIKPVLQHVLSHYGCKSSMENHRAWVNIIRNHQQAAKHCHVIEQESSISWVLFLNDSETSFNIELPHFFKSNGETKRIPYKKIEVTKGKLVVFPSWLMHFSSLHKSDEIRISIAGKANLIKEI